MFIRNKILVVFAVTAAMLLSLSCSKDNNEKQMPVPRSFLVTIENVSTVYPFLKSGVFNTPVGSNAPGAIGPGEAYEFSFSAPPGSRLSFATMFVPSNDFFYAPDEMGIALFDANGNPLSGDITSLIRLWDAGTEMNQEPGAGTNQPQRQGSANSGAADPINQVRQAPDDFHNLPSVSDVIRVTLISSGETDFRLRVENVSTSSTLMTADGNSQAVPLAPGVWVVHYEEAPLFRVGQPDFGQGLAALAEDGDPSQLASKLAAETGLTAILAPGVWAVHTSNNPFFTSGEPERGNGLEALAEDGNPAPLASTIDNQGGITASGVFNTPVAANQPGALLPGNSYQFTFTAAPGASLSFATMFVQSNDLFYAPNGSGIALFESDGQPISGNFSTRLQLWDAGTEVNEEPGVGLNQAPRQAAANTGIEENGVVRPVNDGFNYPAVDQVISVTITPQ